jgi:hypothetical protein
MNSKDETVIRTGTPPKPGLNEAKRYIAGDWHLPAELMLQMDIDETKLIPPSEATAIKDRDWEHEIEDPTFTVTINAKGIKITRVN